MLAMAMVLRSLRQSEGSALSIYPSVLGLPGEQAALPASQHSAMSSRLHICHLGTSLPPWLSGLLRPTEKVRSSFSWEWVMDYFARAAGKMGTSEWPISVVLIFRRQPDELKGGWTDSLRENLFCLIGMKTISKLGLLSSQYLHPLMNQPFRPFWVYWSRQNSGRETVIGKWLVCSLL